MDGVSYYHIIISLVAANVASLATLAGLALHRSFVLTKLSELHLENVELRRRVGVLERPLSVRLRT
nr:hypothetical protein [Brucella anthropi]